MIKLTSDVLNTGGSLQLAAFSSGGTTGLVTEKRVSVALKMTSTVRYTINCLKEAFNKFKGSRFPNCLKVVAIASVPFSLISIAGSVKDLFRSHLLERIDAALNITNHIGTIGDAVATCAEGVSLILAKAVIWAPPLLAVGLALETAGMIAAGKQIAETYRFKKEFTLTSGVERKVEEYTLEMFRAGLGLMDSKLCTQEKFISKHFGVDKESLLDALIDIEFEAATLLGSNEAAEILKGKQLLQTTMKTLCGRMTTTMRSKAVGIVAGTVSYVGVGLLFTPMTTAGFGLLAISGAASLAAAAVNEVAKNRFESELGIDKENA